MIRKDKRRFNYTYLCEESNGLAEEPDQRWHHDENARIVRHEKIRCLFAGVSLFILLFCFLYDFVTSNYLPLLISICALFLGYRTLDAYFRRLDTHSSS